jgi:lysophospholipase L1-like esterase
MRIWIARVAFAVAVCSTACARGSGREASIAALGDSITAGYRTEDAYPEQLGRWRGVPVHNFGKAGDTTEGMLRRLPALLATGPTPQVVLVMGGTNDIGRGWPAARTLANLDAIVRQVRAAGRQPVLVCPPPAGVLPEMAQRSLRHAIREYASRMGVRALDPWDALEDRARPGRMRAELAMDGLHPNAQGQLVLAREIARGLAWPMPGAQDASR